MRDAAVELAIDDRAASVLRDVERDPRADQARVGTVDGLGGEPVGVRGRRGAQQRRGEQEDDQRQAARHGSRNPTPRG